MEQVPLVAEKRTILGRKVKKLRRDGYIPAHVFGHKVKTVHVQVKGSEFARVFEKVGETGIVALSLGGENRPVLVRNVQENPVTSDLIHIDFYQVNLSEKVKVNVPLEITGDSPAVEKKIGLLLTPVSEIEVEALPADLPESIDVDIQSLVQIGDEIKVRDLKIDRAKIEVHTDEELVVVQIGELVTKEMEETEAAIEAEQAETAEETAEGEEAKEDKEGQEGKEGQAEGESSQSSESSEPSEPDTKESKKEE